MSDPVRVPASPAHCRWGAFDASFAPVASVDPGGLVILECLSGGPEAMPPQEKMMAVHPMLREVHAKVPRLGAHIITGPVEVRGAEPGDALRVDIEKIELGADWGFAETGAAGPTGNRYGDAAGHSCLAIAGPVERVITLETGAPDREANMRAFAAALFRLAGEALA